MNEPEYCPSEPPKLFKEALQQIRNYLYREPIYSFFATKPDDHLMTKVFWMIDGWLDAVLARDND